jgi:hypothetical protein
MSNQKKSLDPTVLAAIITVVGGILVAVIPTLMNRAQPGVPTLSPTFTSAPALPSDTPVPTDTVPPGEPTSTPAPATETLTPTFTVVPPVALGQDWLAGCISSLWQFYPNAGAGVPRGDGCLQEPVYVFSAENGDLDFLADSADGPGVYGLFAPLPNESGSVTFRIRLRTLDNVDILMGVYSDADINSQGLLLTIPEGNVKNRVIAQKDNVISYTTLQQTSNLAQGDEGYSLTFDFSLNSIRGSVNPNVFVTNPMSVPSPKKWIFLGYRVLNQNYRVEGTFLSLEVRP